MNTTLAFPSSVVLTQRLVHAVSSQVPEEPVVDTRSGYVYERRLIEKYLHEQGNKCPMTGGPLSSEDLVPIKGGKPVKPRHTPAMSVPGLLATLHNVRSRSCRLMDWGLYAALPLLWRFFASGATPRHVPVMSVPVKLAMLHTLRATCPVFHLACVCADVLSG